MDINTDINDAMSPRHYLMAPSNSCRDTCTYEKTSSPKILNENCSPKNVDAAQANQESEEFKLEITFQTEDDVCCDSGANNTALLQHSDASCELIEYMFEEPEKIVPRIPLPSIKNVMTFKQNISLFEDGSLENSTVMASEEVPSSFDEHAIFFDDMPWTWTDKSSDVSEAMELESSPQSAQESMSSTPISHGCKLVGSSMEFEVTARKILSFSSSELLNEEESSDKCTTSAMAGSLKDSADKKSKDQKQMNSSKVDEQKREFPVLRSSLPMKSSLLGRVKAKKVGAVVDPSIVNEKLPSFDRTVNSVKPKLAAVMPDKGPPKSLSPIIVKKKALSPPKRIHLSPKPILLLKTKSPAVKCRSPMANSGRFTGQSSHESSKIARNSGTSKPENEKILEEIAASRTPKSNANYSPGLSGRKLRLTKNQMEDAKPNGGHEQTLREVERKLVGVARKTAEQKHEKLGSQQSSRTLSSRSSMSSSAFVASSYEEENDESRLAICDANGSMNTHISEGKGRVPLHRIEKKLFSVDQNSTEEKYLKLRSQLSSRTLSSRSSISSSAYASSYEEENDESQFMINDASRLKKNHITDRKTRTPLHSRKNGSKKLHNRTANVIPEGKSSSLDKLPSSAFVSSTCEENKDESQFTISDASGSKKTPISTGKRRPPLCSPKNEFKNIPNRRANACLEDKSSMFDKMSFGRGKEVCTQRDSPRQSRHRYVPAKELSSAEKFEGETGKISFRESGGKSATVCSMAICPKSPTDVPKQQDVQEKNTQALFNVVIEETASKLMETKKSKVKALVGAFESIMRTV